MSTYTPIASITTAGSVSSVVFAGIPQTYTDLVMTAAGTLSAETAVTLRFNDDTTNNYSISYLYGPGAGGAVGSSEGPQSVADVFYFDDASQNSGVVNIMNYSNTTTKKTVISRANGSESLVIAYVGLWQQTAAITSITVLTDAGTISADTTFNLYGVADAGVTNVAKATGGDSVYTDGTYWYHTFLSSGTFTPTQALTADYLVVAGGGGGGSRWHGGGGGAGGLRCTVGATGGGGSVESPISLTASTNYTITVGAGGAGGDSGSNGDTNANAVAGNNSSISGSGITTITSVGGGYGAGWPNAGGAGGSGGGAARGNLGNQPGGAGTTNQGYAGGGSSKYDIGGGGGGASQVGEAAETDGTDYGGDGGNGVTTSISGTSTTYAGGGGGGGSNNYARAGSGGSGGGGGASTSNVNGTSGTANTGGGGGAGAAGAAGNIGSGGNGGSGIVIVRYAV